MHSEGRFAVAKAIHRATWCVGHLAMLLTAAWPAAAHAHGDVADQPSEVQSALAAPLAPRLTAVVDAGNGLRSPDARSLGDSEEDPYTEIVACEAGLRFAAADGFSVLATTFTTAAGERRFDHAIGRPLPVTATGRMGLGLELALAPTPWLASTWNLVSTRVAMPPSGVPLEAGAARPELMARADLAITPKLSTLRGRDVQGLIGVAATARRDPGAADRSGPEDGLEVDVKAGVGWDRVRLELEAAGVLLASWQNGALLDAAHVADGAPLDLSMKLTLELP
jgi:hypothetical protein